MSSVFEYGHFGTEKSVPDIGVIVTQNINLLSFELSEFNIIVYKYSPESYNVKIYYYKPGDYSATYTKNLLGIGTYEKSASNAYNSVTYGYGIYRFNILVDKSINTLYVTNLIDETSYTLEYNPSKSLSISCGGYSFLFVYN